MSSSSSDVIAPLLSDAEYEILKKHLDKDNNGHVTEEEIMNMIILMKSKPDEVPSDVKTILQKYDANKDGQIDVEEIKKVVSDVKAVEHRYRYAGYSAAFARAFRYLAFTSDVGEALRPVARTAVVNASYGVAATYCVVDVAWEAYKVNKKGTNDHGHPMTVAQMIVERSTFQLIASLALPAIIIHTSVDIAKHVTKRIGRFQKWGPSVIGLAIIPLLPMYLDEPAEHAIEWGFSKYGPWADKTGHDHATKDKHN